MQARPRSTVTALAAALAVLPLGGCGSGSIHVPNLGGLPLVPGTQIVTQHRTCDPGANANCAYELVVVNPRYNSSESFLHSERRRLHGLGWSGAYAPNGDEHVVDSPGGKLHLTYATANADLTGIDLGWIKRSRAVALSLSHAIFQHSATLSMLLQFGSS